MIGTVLCYVLLPAVRLLRALRGNPAPGGRRRGREAAGGGARGPAFPPLRTGRGGVASPQAPPWGRAGAVGASAASAPRGRPCRVLPQLRRPGRTGGGPGLPGVALWDSRARSARSARLAACAARCGWVWRPVPTLAPKSRILLLEALSALPRSRSAGPGETFGDGRR